MGYRVKIREQVWKFGEVIENQFAACWKCSTARSAAAASTGTPEPPERKPA